MDSLPKFRRPGLLLGAIIVVAGGLAAWLFPRAMPTLALRQQLTRQIALQRADSFFRAHDLAPEGSRRAVRFQGNDSLRTYVDLAGGGRDTLNALLRGDDFALFTWSVRAFVPHDPHEAYVQFAPDGRVVGFRRRLAEADERPEVSPDSARTLATGVMADWIGQDTTLWAFSSQSYETRKTSGRVDRTLTFERKVRRIDEAPIRLKVVISGDLPTEAHPYVVIPQSFHRRYGEMRSANDLLAVLAQIGMLALLIIGAFALRHYALEHSVRWRPALIAGGVIGALIAAASLNQLPGSWFGYDTATSPATFRGMIVLEAILGGTGMAILVGLTLAAAEAAARHAFPDHLDWWKIGTYRGTRAVAGRVAGGYAGAAFAFAYVALFYLVTRKLLGWWVPTEMIDDPNLISTPLPWVSGVAVSLQAGVWEESLFRALPLSLLAIWTRGRANRRWWLALGVVATAIVFGFAHSNYASWPPYSRGVEIFLDACLWAVLFLWFGLLVTVLVHFVYDLVLFGSFAASGSALPYHVTAAVILIVLLSPALAVAWRWIRQRGLTELPDAARFGAWRPTPEVREAPMAPPARTKALSKRARELALILGAAAVLLAALLPSAPVLGNPFTAIRSQALATADSMLAERGVSTSGWTRLSRPVSTSTTQLRRFLVEHDDEALAAILAARYAPPAWWVVRYVRTGGTPADRAEEWRVRIRPDGTPLDVHHVLPDSLARDTVSDAEARSLARSAVARAGFDTLALVESDLEHTVRPNRRDVTVTYKDTTLSLPSGAEARVAVTLAGTEPVQVRRSVELPETFQRAERERANRRALLMAFCGVLFLGTIVVGGILIGRRRDEIVFDGFLNRRRTVLFVGGLTVLGIAEVLNGLPRILYSYDTAMPWRNFLGLNLAGLIAPIIEALIALALWFALGALRRRVGIRLFPQGAGREQRRDLLLAGLGMGSLLALGDLLSPLFAHKGVPGAPNTMLGQVVPLLGTVFSIPLNTVMAVTAIAIPLLVLVGAARTTRGRGLMGALYFLPLLGLALAAAPEGASLWIVGVSFVVGTFVGLWLLLRYWAPYCAWAWVMAALVVTGLRALRSLFHAPTPIEHGAGLVTLVATLALLVLAVRISERSGREAST